MNKIEKDDLVKMSHEELEKQVILLQEQLKKEHESASYWITEHSKLNIRYESLKDLIRNIATII